jgi:hypothetical protein
MVLFFKSNFFVWIEKTSVRSEFDSNVNEFKKVGLFNSKGKIKG